MAPKFADLKLNALAQHEAAGVIDISRYGQSCAAWRIRSTCT